MINQSRSQICVVDIMKNESVFEDRKQLNLEEYEHFGK